MYIYVYKDTNLVDLYLNIPLANIGEMCLKWYTCIKRDVARLPYYVAPSAPIAAVAVLWRHLSPIIMTAIRHVRFCRTMPKGKLLLSDIRCYTPKCNKRVA